MELIKSYLHSVRLYLPRGDKEDIIKEISDDLQMQMEKKEMELGRSLYEKEEAEIIEHYGDPLLVANRYRRKNSNVAFGRELISAEMFPVYMMMLGVNFVITSVIIVLVIAGGKPLNIPMLLVSILIQFVVVTGVVIILNRLRNKFPKSWLYPPTAMVPATPIPGWQSKSGLIVWSVFTLWWLAVSHLPFLIFGTASDYLKLAPVWQIYYIPILLLLIIGIGQRIVNLIHPHLTWVHSFSRVVTNGAALILQYFIIMDYPYIAVAKAVENSQNYQHTAEIYNAIIMWGILCWLWIFLLINVIVHLWQCILHIRRWRYSHIKPDTYLV